MDVGEITALQEVQRLLKFRFRFPGKSGDQVGGDAAARQIFPQQLHAFIETRAVVFSAHALQRGIAAGLEG